MLETPQELLLRLGAAIRARRVGQGLSQQDAAQRAGMSPRTWRRLETEGQATIGNLVSAAIALRCEDGLSQLFPRPVARNLDELLQRQAASATQRPRQRARRSGKTS